MGALDVSPSKVAPRGKDPAQRVYIKFLVFSATLFIAPLSAFFLAKDRWLNGNATYAGGLAALIVNLVLIAYIVSAFLEDQGDAPSTRPSPKADQQQQQGGSREKTQSKSAGGGEVVEAKKDR